MLLSFQVNTDVEAFDLFKDTLWGFRISKQMYVYIQCVIQELNVCVFEAEQTC